MTIIFQKGWCRNPSTRRKEVGDSILDFVGPLGKPSAIEGYKNACVIGGGVGSAIAYHSETLKEQGAHVDVIAGFRNKDMLFSKMISAKFLIISTSQQMTVAMAITDSLQVNSKNSLKRAKITTSL